MDGVDALVLSNETSIGANAVRSTVQLAKAITEAENIFDYNVAYQDMRDRAIEMGHKADATDVLCSTAMQIARDNNVDMFLTITKTGKIARQLARQRPKEVIVACSINSEVVH